MDPETGEVTDQVLFMKAKWIRKHKEVDLSDRDTEPNEAK